MSALLDGPAIDLLSFDPDSLIDRDPIGVGSCRQVFPISPELVCKTEPIYRGQNRTEILRWIEHRDSGLLAPILAWADDYSWSIMVRTDPVYPSAWGSHFDELTEFCSRAERIGVLDLHTGNFGRLRDSGRLVLIDYAI